MCKNSLSVRVMAVLILVLCLLLSACGSKSPEMGLIEEDLSLQLFNDYGPGFSLDQYEIIQSITDDDIYTATIEATAIGKYANLSLSIDVQYTNYDQGWQSDYVLLYVNSYELVRFPSDEDIAILQDSRNSMSDWDVTYETVEYGNDYFISTGEVNSHYNDYFLLKGNVSSRWVYDLETDSWRLNNENKHYYGVLDMNVEGKWQQYDDNDYIRVKNQTETGMDVCVEGLDDLGDEWVHVELSFDEDVELRDNGLTVVYKGLSSESEELTVTFFMSHYNELGIQVEIPGWFNSRHGYYRDFVSG